MWSKRAIPLLMTMVAALVVASGMALAATIQCKTGVTCYGTKYADTLNGTSGANDMFARAGNDTLNGYGDADNMHGQDGTDTLNGYGGADNIYGQGGADKIFGGGGIDLLRGDSGNDVNNGGAGGDAYTYSANNWGQDTITDTAISDTTAYNGDFLFFERAITANLTINLESDITFPEAYAGGTQSTINWSDDVIDDVKNYAYGSDFVVGSDVANYIRSWNGRDAVNGKGSDDIIDVADGQADDDVDCGYGLDDDVYYDGGDSVSFTSCEHLHLVNPT